MEFSVLSSTTDLTHVTGLKITDNLKKKKKVFLSSSFTLSGGRKILIGSQNKYW